MSTVYDCSNDTDNSLHKSSKDSQDNDEKYRDSIDVNIKSIVNHFFHQAIILVNETQ